MRVLQTSWQAHNRRASGGVGASEKSRLSSRSHQANLAKNYKQHQLRFSGIVVRLPDYEKNRKIG